MKKVLKHLTLGAAVLALAWGFPATTQAACTQFLTISMCASGMDIVGTTFNSHFADNTRGIGGSFWRATTGNPAIGAGDDSGFFGQPVVDPTTFGGGDWLSDFFIGDGSAGERCFIFDWGAPVDGCGGTGGGNVATPADIAVAVVTDTNNNYAVMSVAGNGLNFDWDNILLSGMPGLVLNAFGIPGGIPLQRAVNVASSSVSGSTATVSVNALGYNAYDDQLGARYPSAASLNAQLYGFQGGVWGPLGGAGGAAAIVQVDIDSRLCWGFDTGEFQPEDISGGVGHLGVACVGIGGVTPSQHVDKAVAGKAKGHMKFEWHVTAQLDIVGFDIFSIDPTRGTERKLNSSPIFEGTNDANDKNYRVDFPRSVVKRPGVFELRMTRLDGTVTATTFVNE